MQALTVLPIAGEALNRPLDLSEVARAKSYAKFKKGTVAYITDRYIENIYMVERRIDGNGTLRLLAH